MRRKGLWKKTAALCLAASMVFAAGCGGSGSEKAPAESAAAGTEAAGTEAAGETELPCGGNKI